MQNPRARLAFLSLLLLLPFAALAQGVGGPAQPLSWVPQGFEVLGQRAAFHTDFTFDRTMLQVAGYFVGDADPGTRNAIAKLNGISVHSYHFAAPGLYDARTLDGMRRQFEASGWRHLVAARGKGDPFNPGQTDLWINVAHMDVTGMMLLFSGPRDLNLVAFSGDISTLDLLHLRGHFGIPRFAGDRFVTGSNNAAQARAPYVPADPTQPFPDQAPPLTPDQYPQSTPDQYPAGIGVGAPTVEAAPPPPTPPGF